MAKESQIAATTDEFDPQTIIAGLCSKASTENCIEARDVLRRYNHGHTYSQNRSAIISNFKKQPLVQAAKFLTIPYDGLLKEQLVHEIICQVQNMLPDNCQICNQTYKSNLGDTAYISCDVCGQEVHKPCFMKLLGIEEGTMPNINPSNLPGIHYFCKACEEEVSRKLDIEFPDKRNREKERSRSGKEPIKKSQKQTVSAYVDNPQSMVNGTYSQAVTGSPTSQSMPLPDDCQIVDIIHCSQVASGSSGGGSLTPEKQPKSNTQLSPNKPSPPSPLASMSKLSDSDSQSHINSGHPKEAPPGNRSKLPESQTDTGAVNSNKDPPSKEDPPDPNPKRKQTKTCRFYANNTCRFGAKGKQCPFRHPDRCQKLLNHGTKQPNGCNKGKSCPDFHPKMCPASITKHQCFVKDCHLMHVKGTNRNKESQSAQHKSAATQNKTTAGNLSDKTPVQEQAAAQTTLDQPSSFLELARLIKEELMEVIDKKIAIAINQIPPQAQMQSPLTIPQYYQQPTYYYPPHPSQPPYQPWQQALQAMTQTHQIPLAPQSQGMNKI